LRAETRNLGSWGRHRAVTARFLLRLNDTGLETP
jgi:hypothetical protein